MMKSLHQFRLKRSPFTFYLDSSDSIETWTRVLDHDTDPALSMQTPLFIRASKSQGSDLHETSSTVGANQSNYVLYVIYELLSFWHK